MRRTLSFFFGVLTGGLVGAVVALLFAPESGSAFRIKFRDLAGEFATEIRQAAQTKRIELQERLENLRSPRQSD